MTTTTLPAEPKSDKNGIQASNPYQYNNNNIQGHSNKSVVIRSDKPDSNRNGKWKSALSQVNEHTSSRKPSCLELEGSINLIMVPLGCLVSGAITQPVGRKRSMMFLNLRQGRMQEAYFRSGPYARGQGRMQEASASLCWLRGWVTPDKVQTELSQITKTIEESELKRLGKDGQRRPNYRMYMRRTFLLPYAIVTSLFFIGQFGGMTTLQTYAVGIFESIHAPLDPYFATLLLGVAELGGALLCVVLIHYTGKRPLALISTGGSAACFIVVAVYAQFHLSYGWDSPLVPTVFLVLAAFLTHICIRLLPWMLIGEVSLLWTPLSSRESFIRQYPLWMVLFC
ncbi:facilitated trehalose transporter Tret1-like [Diaphorina citri]|uniref:Facilitated trehalose transporter Tret1-like n=1 Tax=Diaphorina citri TaxID=121845 RepID=A0A3Q0J4I1_DIACI|nr:facilitated trehalose transporter Tret1-like [Diaphorina citri]